ncbi:MAG: M20 aminoacylase family protein [Nitratireductor sp.]
MVNRQNPVIANSIQAMAGELAAIRHDFHRHPELMYEESRTAGIVAQKLREYGFDEVFEGIGRTGVVGILHGASGPGNGPADRVLFRADMDALPIHEETGADHASVLPGKMHACGHDGHTTMLLGGARHLAETRNFHGTLVFCFQPAEEGGAGAKAMIDDGILERWPVKAAYGVHNRPGLPVGHFAARSGAVMASADGLDIVVEGVGGHAARPAACKDPVVAVAHLITALQTIVSRRITPMEPAVFSVTAINGGSAYNVIPKRVELKCSLRAFNPAVADQLRDEVRTICAGVAATHGVLITAERPSWATPYPATINTAAETELALQAMRDIAGEDRVYTDLAPMTGSEDFAFFLQKVPGAYVFVGNGDSAELHHPGYDFNDDALVLGTAFWARLAAHVLPEANWNASPPGV